MSGGYTPVFRSIFTGTLFGKYPDLPLWLVLLAMADKNGIVDAHPSYISAACGIHQDEVEDCIRRFCEPDPASRTPDDDGRRLVPIEGRGFGWRIVNHGKYREKARKAAFDAARIEDGRNRDRMAARRAETRRDPTRPDATSADPPSDSNANTDSDSESSVEISKNPEREAAPRKRAAPTPPERKATRIPEDWTPNADLIAYAERELPNVDAAKLAEAFCDYWKSVAGPKGRKLDWPATWRTWVRRSADRYPVKAGASRTAATQIRFDANGRQISGPLS